MLRRAQVCSQKPRHELLRGVALRYAVMTLSNPMHRTHFISLSSFKGTLLTDYKSEYILHLTYFSPLKEKPLKSRDTEPCQGILTSISQLQMKGPWLGSHIQQCPSALVWILLIVAIPFLIITSLSFQAEALQWCLWDAACEWQEPWMSCLLSFVEGGYLAHVFEDCCVSWEAKRGQSWRVTALTQLVLVQIRSWLSAVIPLQWQCAGCQFLRIYGQAGCGYPENITKELIKVQGSRRKNRFGQLHPGVFARCILVLPLHVKSFPSRERELILQDWLPDWQGIFRLGVGETRGSEAGQC